MAVKLTIDGQPFIVVVNQIACIRTRGADRARIFMSFGEYYDVDETMGEVMAMLGISVSL